MSPLRTVPWHHESPLRSHSPLRSFDELCAPQPDSNAETEAQLVPLLCQKFSALASRVRAAEDRHKACREAHDAAELCLHEAVAARQSVVSASAASHAKLVQRRAAEHARREFVAAEDGAAHAAAVLEVAQRSNARLKTQCAELEERRDLERCLASQLVDSVACTGEVAAAAELECESLEDQLAAMRDKLSSLEQDLIAGSEREKYRRGDVRRLEDKIIDMGLSRSVFDKRHHKRQADTNGVLQKCAYYSKHLDDAKHALHQRDTELLHADEQLVALQAESLQRMKESDTIAQGLAQLEGSRIGLESALRENMDMHTSLEKVAAVRRRLIDSAELSELKVDEAMRDLASVEERVQSAALGCVSWQQRFLSVETIIKQMRQRRDLVQQDKSESDVAIANLQSELARVSADVSRIRRECDGAASQSVEANRQTRLMEPVAAAAKQRAQELETLLAEADAGSTRAKAWRDRLLVEAGHQRDCLRSHQIRNSHLTEKLRSLEKSFLRGVRSPRCPAFVSTNAGTPSSISPSGASLASLASLQPGPLSDIFGKSPRARQPEVGEVGPWPWGKLEEQFIARPAPSPCCTPSRTLPSRSESSATTLKPSPRPAPSPPRSAAALAALTAGLDVMEAVALLGDGPLIEQAGELLRSLGVDRLNEDDDDMEDGLRSVWSIDQPQEPRSFEDGTRIENQLLDEHEPFVNRDFVGSIGSDMES